MRKSIELYYWDKVPNFGDIINHMLFEKVLGVSVNKITHLQQARWIGVGSLLSILLRPQQTTFQKTCYFFDQAISRPRFWAREYILKQPVLNVWTSGFMLPVAIADQRISRQMKIHALRGKKSFEILSQHICLSPKTPLGDGGLLFSELLKGEVIEKKYLLGIIPHYVDSNNVNVLKLSKRVPGSCVIDVREHPLDVLRKIASCQTILSSAMHGLIAADSLGIPNARWKLSTLGHTSSDYEFKFLDYYSIYSQIESELHVILEEKGCDDVVDLPMYIQKYYHVPRDLILEKKHVLFSVFQNSFSS